MNNSIPPNKIQLTIERIDDLRQQYLNNEEYAEEMIRLLGMNYNLLDAQNFNQSLEYSILHELMNYYKKMLTTIPNDLISENKRNTLIKSLDNSVYSSIDDSILSHELSNLIPNEKDSFILIPIHMRATDEPHANTMIIRKTHDKLLIEVFDKNSIVFPKQTLGRFKADIFTAEKVEIKGIKNNNPLNHSTYNKKSLSSVEVSNYFFEIPQNQHDKLIEILSNRIITKFNKNSPFEIYKKISAISSNQYYGSSIGDVQYVTGNCYIKELSGALNHTVFPEKKSSIKLSNGTFGLVRTFKIEMIQKNLTELVKAQLKELNYSPVVLEDIDMLFNKYLELKNERASLLDEEKEKMKHWQFDEFNKELDEKKFLLKHYEKENIPLMKNEIKASIKSEPSNLSKRFINSNTTSKDSFDFPIKAEKKKRSFFSRIKNFFIKKFSKHTYSDKKNIHTQSHYVKNDSRKKLDLKTPKELASQHHVKSHSYDKSNNLSRR